MVANCVARTPGRSARFATRPLAGARYVVVHLGGIGTDVVAAFLQELVEGASLTLHVRLIDGSDTHHVLEAIFKALGAALAQATRPRRRKEEPHA